MKHGKMILGELHADIPVIQGGMGVGISLSGLAGAVAAAGGIGIISTAQIGFREPDFDRDPIACNLRTIGKEIEKARQTARGGIVNEHDLYEAVKSGHIAGAALDVSEQEPMAEDNPLRTLENVIITPHIGMYSKEAIGAVSLICAQNAAAKIEGKELQFQVV